MTARSHTRTARKQKLAARVRRLRRQTVLARRARRRQVTMR